MTRDILADIAAILHPTPDPPTDTDTDLADHETWCTEVAAAQQDLIDRLRAMTEDGDGDPLLAAIENEVAAKQDAEGNIRRLLAYGREFVRPRGYTLESLAQAADMSISGVRTAYDDLEIGQVAEYTGAKPRDRGPAARTPLTWSTP